MRTSRSLALAGACALVPGAATLHAQVFNGGVPGGYVCTGSCSTSGANGAVPLAPGGGSAFGYVTTYNSTAVPNPFSVTGTTNGSQLLSTPFTIASGQSLSFAFNYITSDGTSTFTDYSYVQLVGGTAPLTLFTARTTPSGNTVPGFGLPGLAPGVTLNPGSTPILTGAGSTVFSGLGTSSNMCYRGIGQGCGNTGWVVANYVAPTAGTYRILFGVSNYGDRAYESALAFDFSTGVNDVPVAPNPGTTVPEPGTYALLATGLAVIAGIARRRHA